MSISSDDLKETMEELGIRGSQTVDTLLNSLEQEEWGEDQGDEDDD